jgi:hypothetical protein
MLPVAHIIHQVPGRTRLKLPENRGDRDLFDRLAERLEAHAGVSEVDANGRTGSLLIHHSVPIAQILRFAETNDLFTLGRKLKWRDTLANQTRAQLRTLDERLAHLSEGSLDLRSLMILAFLGLTLIQALRGQILPPASTLLWYAAQLLGIKGDER